MLGLYAGAYRKSPPTYVHALLTNKTHVAPYCVHPRLKRDILPMFISSEIWQRATLIAVLMSGGCFKTARIFERCSRIFRVFCYGLVPACVLQTCVFACYGFSQSTTRPVSDLECMGGVRISNNSSPWPGFEPILALLRAQCCDPTIPIQFSFLWPLHWVILLGAIITSWSLFVVISLTILMRVSCSKARLWTWKTKLDRNSWIYPP